MFVSLSFSCLSFTFLSFVFADSADVESLCQDSSDEEDEDEERAEEKHNAGVTSMDEALRTVAGTADRSREEFLRQNFEMLAESCRPGKRGRPPTHPLT